MQAFNDLAVLAAEIAYRTCGAEAIVRLRPSRPPQFCETSGPFVGRGARQVALNNEIGKPTIATTYFYWYDCIGAPGFLENPDAVPGMYGRSALTHSPKDTEHFTYRNVGLHERELADMATAGVDIVLPVYFGSPLSAPETQRSELEERLNGPSWFSDWALRRVVEARDSLLAQSRTAPAIGMFYDTSSAFNNASGWHLDVREDAGRRWIFETWRNFFSQVPRRHWACIDGRPVVFVYHPAFIRWPPQDMYDRLSDQFEEEFSVRPFVVTAAEQDAVQINDNDALHHSIELIEAGRSFDALSELLASDEVFAKSGGSNSKFSTYVHRKLFGSATSPEEIAGFAKHCTKIGHPDAARVLVRSLRGASGVMAYMAKRWLRLPSPMDDILRHTIVTHAAHAALAADDIMVGYLELLASSACYEASGGTDPYFIDFLDRQTSQVFSQRGKRQAELEALRNSGRRAFVQSKLQSRTHVQGIVSHWFWWYLGRFFAGSGDTEFYWSGAIEPMFHAVPSIGPGYDQSALRTRAPLIASRDDGRRYSAVWENLLSMSPRPWLMHLETWNEFFEGTDICETSEFGRKYIDMTRYFSDRFHCKVPWDRSEITEPDIHQLSPVIRGVQQISLDFRRR